MTYLSRGGLRLVIEKKYETYTNSETVNEFSSSVEEGLSSQEAKTRLEKYGKKE